MPRRGVPATRRAVVPAKKGGGARQGYLPLKVCCIPAYLKTTSQKRSFLFNATSRRSHWREDISGEIA
eukprot:5898968-Pyramimonas_sp.AAC.1